MNTFYRSRRERKSDEQITKKTVFLGILAFLLFLGVVIFGLPLLVRFSIFLGEAQSKNKEVVKEKELPPLAPRLLTIFEATNSANVTIKGLAESGMTIELLKNDVELDKVKVGSSGDFSFGVVLDKGENVFSSVALNEKGSSSEVSKPITVVYDNEPPELTLTNPGSDSVTVDLADYEITGQTEKGAMVTVDGRLAMVDDGGKFKLKVQLNGGKNEMEVIARDVAGNETKKKITIKYDI